MTENREEVDKLNKDIKQLREDLSTLTKDFREIGEQQRQEAMERARKTGETVLGEAQALRGQADERIRKDPLASVLISLGIGFIIGKLLDRRH